MGDNSFALKFFLESFLNFFYFLYNRVIENPYERKPKATVSPVSTSSSTSSSFSSGVENPYKPKSTTKPASASSTPFMAFSSTQEAISSVQEDLQDYRSHPMSGRQRTIEMIGSGVSKMKQEIFILRSQLERSRHLEEFLRHKLAFYQQREEDKLIYRSMEHDKAKDSFNRKKKCSTYAAAKFSPNFKRSYK